MHKERLLKLATHLESGKRGHGTFTFALYSAGDRQPNGCGTLGCAIGECHVVWAKKWSFVQSTNDSDVFLPIYGTFTTPRDSAKAFFRISDFEYDELFTPSDEKGPCAPWNTKVLGVDATAEQVAEGIRQYVAWRDVQAAIASEDADTEPRILTAPQSLAVASVLCLGFYALVAHAIGAL